MLLTFSSQMCIAQEDEPLFILTQEDDTVLACQTLHVETQLGMGLSVLNYISIGMTSTSTAYVTMQGLDSAYVDTFVIGPTGLVGGSNFYLPGAAGLDRMFIDVIMPGGGIFTFTSLTLVADNSGNNMPLDTFVVPVSAGLTSFIVPSCSPLFLNQDSIKNQLILEKDKFKVYPNPFNNLIFIEAEEDGEIIIFNSLGQKAIVKEIKKGKNEIETSTLEKGIYFVKFLGTKRVEKIIKI
jgi:hypothetical protein